MVRESCPAATERASSAGLSDGRVEFAMMVQDPTAFREDILTHAVDHAEENGWGEFHPYEAVIARAKSDPSRTRAALAYWCGHVRDGAKTPVLVAYGGDPLKGSY